MNDAPHILSARLDIHFDHIVAIESQLEKLESLILGTKSPVDQSKYIRDQYPFLFQRIHKGLEPSIRVLNALGGENIILIGHLIQLNSKDILLIPNLGKESLGEIKDLLARHSMHLDTVLSPTVRKELRKNDYQT